jgi:hypothetical protein
MEGRRIEGRTGGSRGRGRGFLVRREWLGSVDGCLTCIWGPAPVCEEHTEARQTGAGQGGVVRGKECRKEITKSI